MSTPGMDSAREMACSELSMLVTDYLDQALTPDDRRRFDEHLAICDSCDILLDQFRATIRAVGATASPDAVSAESRERLLGIFREWTGQNSATP